MKGFVWVLVVVVIVSFVGCDQGSLCPAAVQNKAVKMTEKIEVVNSVESSKKVTSTPVSPRWGRTDTNYRILNIQRVLVSHVGRPAELYYTLYYQEGTELKIMDLRCVNKKHPQILLDVHPRESSWAAYHETVPFGGGIHHSEIVLHLQSADMINGK